LHLSQEFLEKIGGSLSLQSEEGKGTTFYVHLAKEEFFHNKI
jgi:signal transduction histidine kinase